jgi:hypothetical protein
MPFYWLIWYSCGCMTLSHCRNQFLSNIQAVIVFPGSPAAPTSSIDWSLKKTSKMLWLFQQTMHYLVNRDWLSWKSIKTIQVKYQPVDQHGRDPDLNWFLFHAAPLEVQRLQHVNDIWTVNQCHGIEISCERLQISTCKRIDLNNTLPLLSHA